MNKKQIVIDQPLSEPLNELFALIIIDENGNEGIMAKNGLPLVFGYMHNLKNCLENFSDLAKVSGKKIQLCRYVRQEIMRTSE
jgi:hypothetical protein